MCEKERRLGKSMQAKVSKSDKVFQAHKCSPNSSWQSGGKKQERAPGNQRNIFSFTFTRMPAHYGSK
eukprot:706891-Pelagomonas_calceolata.AAC.1